MRVCACVCTHPLSVLEYMALKARRSIPERPGHVFAYGGAALNVSDLRLGNTRFPTNEKKTLPAEPSATRTVVVLRRCRSRAHYKRVLGRTHFNGFT